MKGDPFDMVDSNGFVATRVVYYAQLYPRLREVARQHGYALALHGSLANDLDVLAVPWTEDACTPGELAMAITERAGALMEKSERNPGTKPHGRQTYTILLGGNGGYIDLSIMPRIKK